MKILRISTTDRTYLVPVILTVALCLIVLGMRVPIIPQTPKPKGHHRAVVETQIKAAKAGIEKNCQVVDLCHRSDLMEPPSFYGSPFIPENHSSIIATVVSIIPSRGPPVPCA